MVSPTGRLASSLPARRIASNSVSLKIFAVAKVCPRHPSPVESLSFSTEYVWHAFKRHLQFQRTTPKSAFAKGAFDLGEAQMLCEPVCLSRVCVTSPRTNGIYAKYFSQPFPARTTIGAAALPLGACVEIDLVVKGLRPDTEGDLMKYAFKISDVLGDYSRGRAFRRFAGKPIRLLVAGFLVLEASNNCRMLCSNTSTALSKAPSCPTRTIATDKCNSNDGGRNTSTVPMNSFLAIKRAGSSPTPYPD